MYNIHDGTSITAVCTWWLSRDWTTRGVDKNSWRYLRGTKRWIAARLIRHKEWTAGWTTRTLGKSAAKSPAVAHLHECSPPWASSRGHWPPRHHVARERCLSFASKHLTCLIWSNHPAVNLPRAIRLFSTSHSFWLLSFDRSLSLLKILLGSPCLLGLLLFVSICA